MKTQGTNNVERIKKLYSAFAEGDVDTVLAGFDKDIVWNEAENGLYSDDNPYVGKDAVLSGVFNRINNDWEDFHLVNKKFFNVEDDRVLVVGRYKGTYKTTEKELDAQFAHFWKFREGLATSFQQYTDTKQGTEVAVADTVMEE